MVTTAPRIDEDTTTRTTTIIPKTVFKCLAAIIGMMACLAFVGGSGGSDRIDTVALSVTTTTMSLDPSTRECPKECQYIGKQSTEWQDASGRFCCRNVGLNHDNCHLNSPGNTCNCHDVNFSEPCYIDTRCEPFQTWQDGTCKAKPGAQCDSVECTAGHVCRGNKCVERNFACYCNDDGFSVTCSDGSSEAACYCEMNRYNVIVDVLCEVPFTI